MQVLSRPRSDNAKHFLCALTTVRVVEMWHHAFEKSESDDDIEFRALDTVNSGDGYAHSILEDLLEEAQLADSIHSFCHKSSDARFGAVEKRLMMFAQQIKFFEDDTDLIEQKLKETSDAYSGAK